MLEVRDLRVAYGKTPALSGVGLRVAEGEIVSIIGRNGVGKTTLLKTLIGLLPAQSGTIALRGEDLTALPAHVRARRGLGYVPQGRMIFGDLSVEENLLIGSDLNRGRAPGLLEEVLEEFPRLRDRLRQRGGTLSGGEQQILALARALVGAPTVLLLDEPSAGIQPSIVQEIEAKIAAANRARGLTVLLVEQNIEFAASLSRGSTSWTRDGWRARSRPGRSWTRTSCGRISRSRTTGEDMSVSKPSVDDLRSAAATLGLSLNDEDLASFQALADQALASQRRIEELGEPKPAVRHSRGSGHRPKPGENRLNAWAWRCSIKGAAAGPLAGKRIALKDNVCLAGIPMRNGSAVLDGFVPDVDATVVTRILDAGGEIAGKAVCESMSFSGGSHTSSPAPVLNPRKTGYASGGSSSGSAALVAAGEVDMAIGGDQGGSIRIPSAWCGIVGLKPTYGLVPYTGIFPIDLTLDHAGPMAARVRDVALLLEAIAGSDGLDPRQRDARAGAYVDALRGDVRGLRLALLDEAFGWEGASQPEVDALVAAAARSLEARGATVTRVSIPMHRDGVHIHSAIITEGAAALIVTGNGVGTNWKGYHDTRLLEAFGQARRARADALPETLKLVALLGHYLRDRYHGRHYAIAQNLAGTLRSAYDEALARFDLLVMPTTPMTATRLPPPGASREVVIARAHEMNLNTCPFDVTGHPALTVPCGTSDGLPVGLMLVGRHGEDATVLRAGEALEAVLR